MNVLTAAFLLFATPPAGFATGDCTNCGHPCGLEGHDRSGTESEVVEKRAVAFARAMQAGLAADAWNLLVSDEQAAISAKDLPTGWPGRADSPLLPTVLWVRGKEARVRITSFAGDGRRIPSIVVLNDLGKPRGWRVYGGVREEREIVSLIADAREQEAAFEHEAALELYMSAIRLASSSGRSRWMDDAWMGHDRTVPKVNHPEVMQEYKDKLSLRDVRLTEWGTVAGVVHNRGTRVLERVQVEIACEGSTWTVEVVDVLSGGYPHAPERRKNSLYYEPIGPAQTRAFIEPSPRCKETPTARITDFDLRNEVERSPFAPTWDPGAVADGSTRDYGELQMRFDVRRNGGREAIVEVSNLGTRNVLSAELQLVCGAEAWPVRFGAIPAEGEARRDVGIASPTVVIPDFRTCNKPSIVLDELVLEPVYEPAPDDPFFEP